jgi:negative regulator of flagellin synthesis FlgM
MKINGINMNRVTKLYGENKKVENKSLPKIKQDSVEISTLGKSLSGMHNDEYVINSNEKIEALRNQVSNGTYKPDSTSIAKNIMDALKEEGFNSYE